MVIDRLPEKESSETYLDLACLMGLLQYEDGKMVDQEGNNCSAEEAKTRFGAYILKNTLIRRIIPSRYDAGSIPINKAMMLSPTSGNELVVHVSVKDIPAVVPDSWQLSDLPDNDKVKELRITDGIQVMFSDRRIAQVQSAGQLPTGFDPGAMYASANQPFGLKMTVYGASDAISSMGVDWGDILSIVRPDEVGVYASSAMGQMDDEGAGGYSRAALAGKRPTSKQIALSLAEMPADFINAYIVGSVGHTTGNLGACATFLYNLYAAAEDIQSGKRRVAIVGSSEGAVLPQVVDAYRAMSALGEDAQILALDIAKGLTETDHTRACRPFGNNCGFTLAEGAQFIVLFDDQLALELGAQIHGSVGGVYCHADGFKKSISQPGVGNYITIAKALATARAIVGEKSLQKRSFVQAHGTGTPQNRVTESQVLNQLAKVFGIEKWPVGAVKCYVGHPTGPAAGDQLMSTLGTWKYGIIPGIFTLDEIAEDVEHSNLLLQQDHIEVGADSMDVSLINSKGFGGNNATCLVLSPQKTRMMMEQKHGQAKMKAHDQKEEKVKEKADQYDYQATRGNTSPIYQFGKGVLNNDDLTINSQQIQIKGYPNPIDLNLPNPFPDMVE